MAVAAGDRGAGIGGERGDRVGAAELRSAEPVAGGRGDPPRVPGYNKRILREAGARRGQDAGRGDAAGAVHRFVRRRHARARSRALPFDDRLPAPEAAAADVHHRLERSGRRRRLGLRRRGQGLSPGARRLPRLHRADVDRQPARAALRDAGPARQVGGLAGRGRPGLEEHRRLRRLRNGQALGRSGKALPARRVPVPAAGRRVGLHGRYGPGHRAQANRRARLQPLHRRDPGLEAAVDRVRRSPAARAPGSGLRPRRTAAADDRRGAGGRPPPRRALQGTRILSAHTPESHIR